MLNKLIINNLNNYLLATTRNEFLANICTNVLPCLLSQGQQAY